MRNTVTRRISVFALMGIIACQTTNVRNVHQTPSTIQPSKLAAWSARLTNNTALPLANASALADTT